ncbi:hypothetical protein [Bacteriovorax sp. Seq25_V]|uniref:hypothetical protein n=1 Tax=Bacteriovorax sp. Seq25_V TaxID=1201288 RepID=UPI00054ED777|nr:hypothetical protein [Bacteriovorax sp. Seq25_V]
MTNLVSIEAFKSAKKVETAGQFHASYYSLLDFNDLLAEATILMSDISTSTVIDTEVIYRSQAVINEINSRAKSKGEVLFNAITQISNSLDKNIEKYLAMNN